MLIHVLAHIMAGLVTVAPAIATSSESRCATTKSALKLIAESPWPDRESVYGRKRMRPVGELTELDILEYFTTRAGQLPEIRSTVSLYNHDPGLRTTLTRVWSLPGLELSGRVDPDGTVWFTTIVLTSPAHPLKCGLAVGVPFSRVKEVLGTPYKSGPLPSPGQADATGWRLSRNAHLYFLPVGEEYLLTVSHDDAGAVVSFEWGRSLHP
jgi:hypothetical protein